MKIKFLIFSIILVSSSIFAQTQNHVAKFDAGSNTVDSQIFDDGTNVGIGTVTPSFKFHVQNGSDDGTGFVPDDCFGSSSPMPNTAIGILSISNTGGGSNLGVQGVGYDDNSVNLGGHFKARGNWTDTTICMANAGVFGGSNGVGYSSSEPHWINNFGVIGSAHGQNAFNVGGYFGSLNKNCTGVTIGALCEANSGSGIAGLYAVAYNDSSCVLDTVAGGDTALFAAYFEGDIFLVGQQFGPSDERLKRNMLDVQNASDLLSKLEVKSYDYNREEYSSMQLPAGKHYGVIAQEVEKVFPTLVKNMRTLNPPKSGYIKRESYQIKAVNYQEFIPLLIAAHNEQKREMEEQVLSMKNEIKNLQQEITKICEEGCGKVNSIHPVNEGSILDIFPNPAANNVQVSYTVSSASERIELELRDASGKLHSTEIMGSHKSGSSTFDVSALPAGSYFIILKANGVTVQTNTVTVAR